MRYGRAAAGGKMRDKDHQIARNMGGEQAAKSEKADCVHASRDNAQHGRQDELPRHTATPRDGGAMNSGPTGSVMVSRRISSILAISVASSDQPVTSSTGRNCSGWRAPHKAVVMPWSSIQRIAR